MNNSISIDPQGLKKIATNVQNDASKYETEIKEVYRIVEAIKGSWAGKDSQQYIAKVNSYKTQMENLGKIIQQYGEFIQKVGTEYQKTQDEIQKAFK